MQYLLNLSKTLYSSARARLTSLSETLEPWARYIHQRWVLIDWQRFTPAYQAIRRFVLQRQPGTLPASILSSALNILLMFGLGLTMATSMYTPPPAQRYKLSETLAIPSDRKLILLDANGEHFANRGGCVDRPVTVSELPEHFIDALLAMEDRRFYHHFGIDPVGILRAAMVNYEEGRIVQGGSTITQQLAKATYLTRERTMNRKFEEALIALQLELGLTKDEILERYLSRVYLGEGCYGLRAATKHYFNKDVQALTLTESAFLVGLLKSPTTLSGNRPEAAKRAQLVLKAMVEHGSLDQEEMETLTAARPMARERSDYAGYYADWVAQIAKPGGDATFKPLTVRTSLEPKLQRLAEEALQSVLDRYGKSRRASQAALVAMRPDGRVVAMVGGRNYGKSEFNRAYQALRQPGSAFKTFVYFAALRGGAQLDMVVPDEPLMIGDWEPKNYGHNYRGPVSMYGAFAGSINTVAVRLSETAGRAKVIKAARDLGLSTPLTDTPSIALGASEVTLLELTSAYAAISANAYPVKPWGVLYAGDTGQAPALPEGAGKWRLERGQDLRQLLSATVQHGTGRGARLPVPAYGKTGTSQDFRDAWFVGFAGNLVVGVWFGNDDNTSMRRVTGGSLPAMAWRKFMIGAIKQDKDFRRNKFTVAQFPAKPRRDRYFDVSWGYYGDMVSGYMYADAGSNFWGPYGPRPSLLGRMQEPEFRFDRRQRRERRQRRRSSSDFNPFNPR